MEQDCMARLVIGSDLFLLLGDDLALLFRADPNLDKCLVCLLYTSDAADEL